MQAKANFHAFDIQRRVIANRTLMGWQTAPHAIVGLDLDVTDLLALMARLKKRKAFKDTRITFNSLFLKLVAEGVKESPEMNAHVAHSQATGVGHLAMFDEVNIATPMLASCGRMISPVIMNAGQLSLLELCRAMEDSKRKLANTDLDCLLREAAWNETWERLGVGDLGVLRRLYPNFIGKHRLPRITRDRWRAYYAVPESDRITPDNLVSATCIVSNGGSILPHLPVKPLLLELIPPQSVAIGVGSITDQPVAVPDASGRSRVAVRKIVPIALCFDHRAMDLSHLSGFMEAVAAICKDPERVLAHDPPQAEPQRKKKRGAA